MGDTECLGSFEDEIILFHPTTLDFSCGPPLEHLA
jgi:hypothetical protein